MDNFWPIENPISDPMAYRPGYRTSYCIIVIFINTVVAPVAHSEATM